MKRKFIIVLFVLFILFFPIYKVLYKYNYVPHKKFESSSFSIEQYKSSVDKDGDSIDDQTDILNSAREYIAKKPKYKSKYYGTGYPDDDYGVCTDVIAFALLGAGYDLRTLINEDAKISRKDYPEIKTLDKNIDFRRVRNIQSYLKRHGKTLTTNVKDIKEWQGGDIVVFKTHIGLVSDKRNKDGVTFVIHHTDVQASYEEDILETRDDIVGHYRVS